MTKRESDNSENKQNPHATAPKKSLGQNFLTSEGAIFKMITAAKITPVGAGATPAATGVITAPRETVLEVGPGKGVLTKALLGTGAKVIAVEKDHQLIDDLAVKFAAEISAGQLKIVEADILEIESGDFEKIGLPTNKEGEYKIVANIPYYITGQFLRKFLSVENYPSAIVVLLQKEVVERIIAADKKESLLSVSVKVYGEVKRVGIVKRGSFFPAPNVDSAILSIENISKDFFAGGQNKNGQDIAISEEKFFAVLHAGFAHKRKMLLSNLTELASREKLKEIFTTNGISEKIRAEDLTLSDWKKITEQI